MSWSLYQNCRAGNGRGRGAERETVTRVLPIGPGQILSPWAIGLGPGTTLKYDTAVVFPVPAKSDLGI